MNDLWREAGGSMAAVMPLLVLSLGASLVLLLPAVPRRGRLALPLSILTLCAAAWAAWVDIGRSAEGQRAYQGFIRHDAFGSFAALLFTAGAALVCLLSSRYMRQLRADPPEYYGLTLFAAAGMIVMAQASDLLALFLGIEILSLAFYALIALPKSRESVEAAVKYFLMGAFASGFYLMGTAYIFGASGSTRFDGLPAGSASPLLAVGAALLLSAIAFKLALPPFHMWAPDAYQGAPSTVTAFMAFGTKAAVFLALVRFVSMTRLALAPGAWQSAAVALAVTAMIWGNTVALAQSHLRRLIAYSSISHAGTILLGVAAGAVGGGSVLFYLVAYTFAIAGIFGAIVALERGGREVLLVKDLAGLGRRSPVLAGLLTLFLLSLAGFPPTAGFFGKFLVFSAAVKADLTLAAVIGALASVIGVFYYLSIVVAMYMREAPATEPAESVLGLPVALALLLAFAGTLPLGLFPDKLIGLADVAIRSLG